MPGRRKLDTRESDAALEVDISPLYDWRQLAGRNLRGVLELGGWAGLFILGTLAFIAVTSGTLAGIVVYLSGEPFEPNWSYIHRSSISFVLMLGLLPTYGLAYLLYSVWRTWHLADYWSISAGDELRILRRGLLGRRAAHRIPPGVIVSIQATPMMTDDPAATMAEEQEPYEVTVTTDESVLAIGAGLSETQADQLVDRLREALGL